MNMGNRTSPQPEPSSLTDARDPKYAPAREDGLKPWHATISEWGKERTKIVYAESAAYARHEAVGGMRYTSARVRRATPQDIRDDHS